MFSTSPVSDLSTFTPRMTTSICNSVTPGDFRHHVKKPIMIIPEYNTYDETEESDEEYGLTHSVSRMSLSSSDEDVDVDVDVDDEDVMSTSTSPSTSESNTPVSSPISSCGSRRCTPAPKLPPSPCQHPTPAPLSRPWSGCLSCDHPDWGRPCTQSYLLDLAISSCRTSSSPVPISHICTSSCHHHRAHIHYEKPAFLKKMTLNPAGFIRVALPETEQDMESTQLGHRKLGGKHITPRAGYETPVSTRRTSIAVTVARTPIPVVTPMSAGTESSATKPRKLSIFTFETTTPATTQPNETPRLPRRSSLNSPIHLSTPPAQSFVPTLAAVPSPRITPPHALSLTPVIDTTSELDISIEVPKVHMSPNMYATTRYQPITRPIHRTASTMALAQQEQGCGIMSPPLPSSAMVPTWHTKTKHQQPFHLVLPPVSRKFHGVIPSSTSCVSSMPSTWTQPKLVLLYVCYLFLNAVLVLVLHH